MNSPKVLPNDSVNLQCTALHHPSNLQKTKQNYESYFFSQFTSPHPFDEDFDFQTLRAFTKLFFPDFWPIMVKFFTGNSPN